jgi:hypothetical protein
MKYEIQYHEIKSDHMFARPEYDRSEWVECFEDSKLQTYIESQTDGWGNHYMKDEALGFDYISRFGAVKVKRYEPFVPNFVKL